MIILFKKTDKKLKDNLRFSPIRSIKQKIIIRRKKIWIRIIIIYVTFELTMNSCRALPELPVRPSTNVINPEQTIEVVNRPLLSKAKKTITENSEKSKGLETSDTKQLSNTSDRFMTLDKLKKKSSEAKALDPNASELITLFFEHSDKMQMILSWDNELKKLSILHEEMIKTQPKKGTNNWRSHLAKIAYESKLEELQSKVMKPNPKNSKDNNAIFRTNNNGVLQNGHFISGKNYNLLSKTFEKYDITIIKN